MSEKPMSADELKNADTVIDSPPFRVGWSVEGAWTVLMVGLKTVGVGEPLSPVVLIVADGVRGGEAEARRAVAKLRDALTELVEPFEPESPTSLKFDRSEK